MASETMSTPVHRYFAKSIDAITYGIVVSVFGWLICTVLGLLLLGSWSGVKFLLFIAGFLQIAIGVTQLWPTDVSDLENANNPDPDDVSHVQIIVNRIAPIDRLGLPPTERFEPGVKRFVAGLMLLGISLSMEVVFGIGG